MLPGLGTAAALARPIGRSATGPCPPSPPSSMLHPDQPASYGMGPNPVASQRSSPCTSPAPVPRTTNTDTTLGVGASRDSPHVVALLPPCAGQRASSRRASLHDGQPPSAAKQRHRIELTLNTSIADRAASLSLRTMTPLSSLRHWSSR